MKNLFTLFVILFALLHVTFAQPKPQDTSVVWSINTWQVDEIFNSPDGKFIYVNQNTVSRFLKIDAMTGAVIDSGLGKGMICGISSDNRFLYTRWGSFESIKKLDINTYKALDSIDDMQDIKDTNKIWMLYPVIQDMKLSNDDKLFVSILYGKYILAVLDANNLEIINKKLASDISDSIIGAIEIAVSPNNDYYIQDIGYQAYDKQTFQWNSWFSDFVCDAKTLKPLKSIYDKQGFWDFKFSPDGNYFGLNWGGQFNLYKTTDYSLYKQMNISHEFDFSNDSNIIAISIGANINLYNLNDFSEICSNIANYIAQIKFSNDNKYIYIYNANIGQLSKLKICTEVNVKEYEPINKVILNVDTKTNELIVQNLEPQDRILDFQISDVKGIILISQYIEIINEQCKINIKDLPNGVYFLTLKNNSYKFMVVR